MAEVSDEILAEFAELKRQVKQQALDHADLSKKVTLRLLGNFPVTRMAGDPNSPIQATEIATNDAQVIGASWTNNSPVSGSVAWGDMVIMNNGDAYPITAGSTSEQFLYWDVGDSTLTGSATFVPQIDRYLIGTNVSGSLDESWNKIGSKSIVSSQIDSINASIITGQIVAAQIQSITAGQITGSITASSIAAINITGSVGQIPGTLVAGQVPSSFITAGMINTVTAGQITGSITSGQIGSVAATTITGSITSSQIGSVAASTITGSITSGQITSITSAQITGSITASSIAAINITGTINNSQTNMGNYDNLCEDPGFERNSLASWPGVAAPWSIVNDAVNARTGAYCLKLLGVGVNVGVNNIVSADCKTGDEFYFECYAKVTAYTSGNAQVGIAWYDSANSLVSLDLASNITGVQSYTLYSVAAAAPATAVKARVILGTTLTGTAYLDDFYLKRKVGSTGVSALAINATHIASVNASAISGSITAGQITSITAAQITGSISSGQIGSVSAATITGSITAGQITSITAGQITGSITAGSVAASNITGTITSSQIASVAASTITGSITSAQIGSVSASAITGSITAGQITSLTVGQLTGQITGSQIDSLTITASNIANLTINAAQINNSTITEAKLAFQINSPYKPIAVSTATITTSTVSGSNTFTDIVNVSEQGLLVSIGFYVAATSEDAGNSGSITQVIGINIDGQGEQLLTVHTYGGGSLTDGRWNVGFAAVSTDHEGIGGTAMNYINASFGIPYSVSLRVRHGYIRTAGTSASSWNQYTVSVLRAQKI